ncbi:MAG: secondary thiamine-phosphate synthase enzyme YjbQ [Acidimicrobiia bacterium]
MRSTELRIETGNRVAIVDITSRVAEFCAKGQDGLVSVFVPHATAGVGIIETGAGTDSDLADAIDRLLPAEEGRWRHAHGSAGHGRDHVLPAFISPSLTVPVTSGEMSLGTWQSIVLVDTNVDNPSRRVILSFLDG